MTPLIPTALFVGLTHVTLLFAHGCHIALAHGIVWGTGRRSTEVAKTDLDRRFERSISNNVESLTAFGLIAGSIAFIELESLLIEQISIVYASTRLLFIMSYLLNIPIVRTVFWLIGQSALVMLAVIGVSGAASAI
jgi:uncharacterized MAPEG superfamily protein